MQMLFLMFRAYDEFVAYITALVNIRIHWTGFKAVILAQLAANYLEWLGKTPTNISLF